MLLHAYLASQYYQTVQINTNRLDRLSILPSKAPTTTVYDAAQRAATYISHV